MGWGGCGGAQLGIREDDVFTEFTASSFFSPDGLEATAPVFSNSAFPELPSPLGQVIRSLSISLIHTHSLCLCAHTSSIVGSCHTARSIRQVFATFDNFKRLPLSDRASMVRAASFSITRMRP